MKQKHLYIAALLIYVGAFVGKAAADTVASNLPWWLPLAVGTLHAVPAFLGFKIRGAL